MLLCLFREDESHGRAISRGFAVSLEAVQRQLDRFEKSGTLVCKQQGRTHVYSWNPKSRLAARLRDLTGVIYDGLSPEAKRKRSTEPHYPARPSGE